MLIANNQTAHTRARQEAKAAADRELYLATKEADVRTMVENHISGGIESVLRLED